MSNEYFDSNDYPQARKKVLSSDVRSILNRIEKGFEKLPTPNTGGTRGFKNGYFFTPTMLGANIRGGDVGSSSEPVDVVANFFSLVESSGANEVSMSLYNRGTQGSPIYRWDFVTKNIVRMGITNDGDVFVGNGTADLIAAADIGFFHVPAIAAAPSGTPTAVAGSVPIVYNRATNQLAAYNGSWRSVSLS